MGSGSIWKIWDFHLHTPYSVLNNQYGAPDLKETWDHYIDMVEKKADELQVSAIGFTDYFTIEGYKRVLEYKQQGRLENLFIFPNIEFRIDKIVYRDKNGADPKRLNVHVLFSPEIDCEIIEEDFLRNIDFVFENEPFEAGKIKKLNVKALTRFGKELQRQHPQFQDRTPFEIGCMNAVVKMEQIRDVLRTQFKGKYLLVLADENLSELGWNGQDHATRKQLIQMSHAVFSSNQGTRDFCLGKKHESVDAYLAEFKSLKPCIWGCDGHSYQERFLQPEENRYCWIKGETTWEGLKQILFEPEDRIRIQEANPEHEKSIFTISEICVPGVKVNDKLQIENTKISLNSNLVTIIGGRGSGKTALLDLIACCFQEGDKLSKNEQSFIYRLYGGENTRRTINQSIPVDISFISGDTFEKTIGTDEQPVYFDKSNIIYLTQNHFDEFSASPDRLNEHIINLVFEKFSEEKMRFEGFGAKISDLEREIQSINLKIEQLYGQIQGKREQSEKELSIKYGEKEDIEKRIQTIEKKQGAVGEELSNITNIMNDLQQRRRDLDNFTMNLATYEKEFSIIQDEFLNATSSLNEEIKRFFGDNSRHLFPTKIDEMERIDRMFYDLGKLVMYENDKNREELQHQQEIINELEGINRVIAELHQKRSFIDIELVKLHEIIKRINMIEKEIKWLENERYTIFGEIIKNSSALKTFLQTMIDKFEVGKDAILNNLEFSAQININDQDQYLHDLLEKLDNRIHSEADLQLEFADLFSLLFDALNNENNEENIQLVIEGFRELSNRYRLKRSTTSSEFYNALLKRPYQLGLRVKFNGKPLEDLSMGERAIVLLKILLALDDKPLLIDQPEEHLDNRYIYTELMPAFRDAKKRRQIIIATHNANLVVNTDAEQVIIANSSGGCLSYQEGTLESISIRESITDILEGGDKAFKKREEKYGYIY